ncbi:peptidoglycan-binding protein [Actinokineospora soli]|uniref:Peptidoglycan-binding protein n=1 Tax=Actinokineospora soli TaxID=1048753 RepID=A0ABW2TM70_9PSEU
MGRERRAAEAGECHGWAFRPIAGTNVLSNHASGTAIDLNAPTHPQGKFGTVPGHLRDDITAKAASLGLRWGGNFTGSRVDEMHFEVLPGGGGGSSARPTLRRGSTGPVVRELQTLLNRGGAGLVVDGLFGPRTDAAVRQFQRRHGLAVDGIVGRMTWAKLLG